MQPSHGFARFLTLREVENGCLWVLFCDSGTTQHKEGFQYDIDCAREVFVKNETPQEEIPGGGVGNHFRDNKHPRLLTP